MSTTLGSAFTPQPTIEPDPDELADLALLAAVQDLTEKVANLELPPPVVNIPAPRVRVDVPPLPAVPTAAEIGAAVAHALPADDDSALLLAVTSVKDAVDKLAKKTTAPRFGTGGGLAGAAFDSAGNLKVVTTGSGGGGGGPATVADGADVAQGTTTDAEAAAGNGTVIALLKRIRTLLGGTLTTSVQNFPATQPVSIGATVTTADSRLPAALNADGGLLAHIQNFPATQPVSAASLPLPTGAAQDGTDISSPTAMPPGGAGIRGWLSAIWTKLNGSLAVTGTFWQATQPVVATAMTDGTQVAQIRAATTYATVVSSAISLGATLTLPAPGAGLFHYITSIEITNYTGIARTGGATPITVTTTNLTGTPAYTFGTAAAIGTTDRLIPIMCAPVKSAAANTATTIVCPVTTGSFWRVNVTYYVAA